MTFHSCAWLSGGRHPPQCPGILGDERKLSTALVQEKKVRHSARYDEPGRLDICASFPERKPQPWASLATKAGGASGGAGPHHLQVPVVKNSSRCEVREEEMFYSGEHFANSETQPLAGTASVLSPLLERKGPPRFLMQMRNSNCRLLIGPDSTIPIGRNCAFCGHYGAVLIGQCRCK